jgi:GNAT superfamily N-acetyltransferase
LKGVLKRLIILNLFPEEPASYYNSMLTFIDGEPLLLNLSPVTKENFRDVPDYCGSCLYWQSEGDYDAKYVTKERGHKKLGWLLQIQKESEYSGGFVAYHDGDPLGFVQWGHAKFFPKAREYRSGPLSEDAAFLACLYITKEEDRKKGLGTLILKAGISQIRRRGFNAIETFARKSSYDNPSGPLEFYLKNGFKIIRNNSDFPLVRLELK